MASYQHGDPDNARKARRLLKDLLPRAKARARKLASANPDGPFGMTSTSAIGDSTLPFFRADNLEALHVYQAEQGGWHADIALKRTPPGVPNIMGTPVESPCATRAEALDAGINLLVAAIEASNAPKLKDAAVRYFELYDLGIPLPGTILDILAEHLREFGEKRSEEDLRARIDEVCAELFGGPPTEEDLDNADHDTMIQLMSVLALSLLNGVFRHPANTPGKPKARPERVWEAPGEAAEALAYRSAFDRERSAFERLRERRRARGAGETSGLRRGREPR